MTFGNFTDYDNENNAKFSSENSDKNTFSVDTSNLTHEYSKHSPMERYNDNLRKPASPSKDYNGAHRDEPCNREISEERPNPGNPNVNKNRILVAVMWVVPILSLVLLLTGDAKKEDFIFHHARQSLVLGVTSAIITFVLSIFFTIFSIIPIFKSILDFLSCGVWGVFSLIWLTYVFIMAYKAYQGERQKVLILGDIIEQYIK